MTLDSPLVSILILTMNHENFIEQACESAFSQTYPHLEIILLDNASTDSTFELAKEKLQQGNVPHKTYKNENSFGVAKNLNFLLSKAQGKYVGILSGDDWWDPKMIAEKVNYIQEKKCDFVLSDGYKYWQENGQLTEAYSGKDKEKVIGMLGNFFHENVTENRTVNVGTFVKKDVLDLHPFDETIQTEDWDMNLRLTNLGYTLGFIDQKLFYYRVLPGSLSRKWDVMQDAYRKVTAKYQDYIQSHPDLLRKYQLNLLKFKYEILLSENQDIEKRKEIKKQWTEEKYKLKYQQPWLFFKLLLLKLK